MDMEEGDLGDGGGRKREEEEGRGRVRLLPYYYDQSFSERHCAEVGPVIREKRVIQRRPSQFIPRPTRTQHTYRHTGTHFI